MRPSRIAWWCGLCALTAPAIALAQDLARHPGAARAAGGVGDGVRASAPSI